MNRQKLAVIKYRIPVSTDTGDKAIVITGLLLLAFWLGLFGYNAVKDSAYYADHSMSRTVYYADTFGQ
jgi:hypothetical protein